MQPKFRGSLEDQISLLLGVGGVVVGVVAIVVLIALMIAPRLRWVAISFMMWFSSLGTYYSIYKEDIGKYTLASPLEEIRGLGRIEAGVVLAVLALHGLATMPVVRMRQAYLAAAVGMSCFQGYYALRMIGEGFVARGVLGAITYTLMFLFFCRVLPRELQRPEDLRNPLWAIVGGAVLNLLGIFYQLGINVHAMSVNGRFTGTTENPQFAGLLFALAIPPMMVLLLDSRTRFTMKYLLIALIATSVVMLLWTGSRTALATAVLGVVLTLRGRIGPAFVYSLLVAVAFFLVVNFLPDSLRSASRMSSGVDTRSSVWEQQWTVFQSSPVWGTFREAFGENSYLAVAASMGLSGLLPLGVVLFLIVRELAILQRSRSQYPELQPMIDVATAGIVAILAGAVFDAILLGIYTYPVFALFLYFAMILCLRNLMAKQPRAVSPLQPVLRQVHA